MNDVIKQYAENMGDEPPEGMEPMMVTMTFLAWEGMPFQAIGLMAQGIGTTMMAANVSGPGVAKMGILLDGMKNGQKLTMVAIAYDAPLPFSITTRLPTDEEGAMDTFLTEQAARDLGIDLTED